jgi:cytochrome P450
MAARSYRRLKRYSNSANAHRHAAFGFGIHRCFGRHVARLELQILLEEVLDRFERIEVVAPPERLASNFSTNYARLMVRTP